jgi:hypothetical protein
MTTKRKIHHLIRAACAALALTVGATATAGERIAMHDKGASTFYVSVTIAGAGTRDYLIDTGSSLMTIDQATLATVQANGGATYVRNLKAYMADGRHMTVPVYRITAVTIGSRCHLRDVTAAVFPGKHRPLLGINALRQAAPIQLTMDPPTLDLGGCAPTTQTASLD